MAAAPVVRPDDLRHGTRRARRSTLTGNRGFTLVEILVAVAITGLVALLLHRSLAELHRLGDRAAAARSRGAQSAAVRRQITSWLRGVYVDPMSGVIRFDGIDGVASSGGGDRLAFWTTADGLDGGGPSQVSLEIEPGVGLVAYVADRTMSITPDPRRVVLAPGADRLEARYYVELGLERVWLPTWSSAVTTPVAVELRILGRDVAPLLRIPVLVGYGR